MSHLRRLMVYIKSLLIRGDCLAFSVIVVLCFPLTGPVLSVEVTPGAITVLDVSPYNLFSLLCTATQPSSITVSKTITWSETYSGFTLSDNGDTVNITTTDLGNTTTSILSVRANESGALLFACNAKLEVSGDPVVMQSQAAGVTVRGKANPSIHLVPFPLQFACQQ